MRWVFRWKKSTEYPHFMPSSRYSQKGKYKISVCLGTACYVKGSGEIFRKLEELLGITNGECTADGKFSLDSCRCVGAADWHPL